MSNSTNFRDSIPPLPVQSVLPLFEVSGLGGARSVNAASRTRGVKSGPGRDPLKQAQRVATALRRGEIDVGARQAAVNSLCQYLIDSLESSSTRMPH